MREKGCGKFIDSVQKHPLELKAYILQMLLDSFEDVYEIDIRKGISIKEE